MIYRNEVLIDWKKGKGTACTEDEAKVYQEITAIKNKYFGDNTMKIVTLLYPKGEFKDDGSFVVPKLFPIPLSSSDGVWRYSESKIRKDKTFVDSAKFIKHQTTFTERDLEFLWFLVNKSALLNRFVFIEDLEAKAEAELNKMADDADIRFMITSPRSPFAKDEKAVREVAEIFGVQDVNRRGIGQIKKDLYDTLVRGQKMNDRFINFDKFDELTQGEVKRKAAFKARESINDKVVKFQDGAWWLMHGSEPQEKLMTIKQKDAGDKEKMFIDEIVNNPNTRSRLFTAIGEEESVTAADYRELSVGTLRKKVSEECGSGAQKASDTKEDLIRTLCEKHGIDYQEGSK